MTRTATITALAAALVLGVAAEAAAWERKGSVTTLRGTGTVDASGSCSGASCSRTTTRTGAYGATRSTTGSGSCAGGACTGSKTTTGPAGATRTRTGSISR